MRTKNARMDLFKKKVISDQERDTAIAAAGSSRANVEADEAAVETGRAESRLYENHGADRWPRWIREQSGRRSGRANYGTTHDQFHRLIRSKPS